MTDVGIEGPMNVVVTGGGTIAPIDDVRHIANASSGSFAARICEAWLARGATVRHLRTPNAEAPFARSGRFDLDAEDPGEEIDRLSRLRESWHSVRGRYREIPVASGTASGYGTSLEGTLRAEPADVVMLVAAVSDYEPVPTSGKIASEADELIVRCRRTPKVIRSVRDWAPGAFLVGFKLLSGASDAELIREAERGCRVNRADLTVANDLRQYRAGRHALHLVRIGHPVESYGPDDGDLAARLVDRIARWSVQRRERPGN